MYQIPQIDPKSMHKTLIVEEEYGKHFSYAIQYYFGYWKILFVILSVTARKLRYCFCFVQS